MIEILLTGICASSIVFWLLSVAAAADLFRRRGRSGRWPDGGWPPVSILKPIRGLDPDSYENFSSFARQRYARFEILFGAEAADDPGLEVARRIQRDFPGVPVKIVDRVEPLGENPKVNTLASLEREASHPLLLISDSDIRVRPGYLRAMVRRLSGENVAMVTSLYSSRAQSWAGRLEALGTATEFQPGVLVARIVERVRFGLGAGILIRRDALGSIGGFRAIADYLADDYMLGSLCFRAGHRIELATAVAEHQLGSPTLSEWIGRQVRWNRGIRVSRRAGYFGLALTQGVAAAALLLLATGASAFGWLVLAATMAVRLASAWIVGARYLRDPTVRRFLWLVPLRDLAGTALWAIGLFGKQIRWRGQRFRLAKDGRLRRPIPPRPSATPPRMRGGDGGGVGGEVAP